MSDKPFAPSCERNQQPILEILLGLIPSGSEHTLFEVGSGTGQHAVYCAPHFPNLTWITSDLPEKHSGIQTWIHDSGASNIMGPVPLDLRDTGKLPVQMEYMFSANVLHIISWELCLSLFDLAQKTLSPGGMVLFYGPFNYKGQFTSESNEAFDKSLKDRDPQSGIRDFESIATELLDRGIHLEKDYEMPANNRFLVFQK